MIRTTFVEIMPPPDAAPSVSIGPLRPTHAPDALRPLPLEHSQGRHPVELHGIRPRPDRGDRLNTEAAPSCRPRAPSGAARHAARITLIEDAELRTVYLHCWAGLEKCEVLEIARCCAR